MNKIPWFTHDNTAHQNLRLRKLLQEKGLRGYGLFWILVEVYDLHSEPGPVTIPWPTIEAIAHTKRGFIRDCVKVMDDLCLVTAKALPGHCLGTASALPRQGLVYDMPNFRKRQAKLKSKRRLKTPLDIDIDTPVCKTSEPPSDFTHWWTIYPRHAARAAALKAWKALKPGKALVAVIMRATEAYRDARKGEDPKFTPHGSTWLNQRRWEDVSDKPKKNPSMPGCPHNRCPINHQPTTPCLEVPA